MASGAEVAGVAALVPREFMARVSSDSMTCMRTVSGLTVAGLAVELLLRGGAAWAAASVQARVRLVQVRWFQGWTFKEVCSACYWVSVLAECIRFGDS